MVYNPTLSLFYCLSCLAIRFCFMLIPVSFFFMHPFFLRILFLTFWHLKMKAHLTIFLAQALDSTIYLNMESKFLLAAAAAVVFNWRMVFRKKNIFSCAHCYWGIINTNSCQWTELGNTWMYTNPCIYTYLNICIYI